MGFWRGLGTRGDAAGQLGNLGVSTDELAQYPSEFLGFNNVLCFCEILTF